MKHETGGDMRNTASMVAAIGLAAGLAGCARQEQAAPAETASATAQTEAAVPAPGCEPDGNLRYLCGLTNAEDLIQIGTSKWLIASGMDGRISGTEGTGHLYLIDHQAKTWEEWFPAEAPVLRHDTALFGGCPGPLDTAAFSAHGLALRERTPGVHHLYMTSHGAREAIEVFEVNATGEKPTAAWIGCVPLPEAFFNSVAILKDGGFVTTKMSGSTGGEEFAKIMRGENSGQVYEWHPGGQVQAVAGTELSGANGIAVSADDSQMFVAAFGKREIVRFERGSSPLRKQVAAIDLVPDNLRWTANGKLYVAGGNVPQQACATPPCETGWSVFEVDPVTLASRRVGGADEKAKLHGVSVGLPVGSEIWVGTYSGDRVG